MQQSLFKLTEGINVLPFEGEALFYPDFLSLQESEFYFQHILHTFTWKQEKIIIYDKEVLQPRLTAYCGDPYDNSDFGGNLRNPQPWTEKMLELKLKVEAIAGVKFTNALFNLYRNGKDSVSWHRDKEVFGARSVIGSVSLGAARTFQFRNYKNKQIMRTLELNPGSLLIMGETIQQFWEHQVPKTNKRLGARINITFRIIK